MTRIVLADDQELVRASLRMILSAEAHLEVVGEATDGSEAVDLAHALLPDVVLMDIRMNPLDGIEATRRTTGELYVSVQALERHVARLLSKLGLRDRVQAVVLAYENGLVRPGE